MKPFYSFVHGPYEFDWFITNTKLLYKPNLVIFLFAFRSITDIETEVKIVIRVAFIHSILFLKSFRVEECEPDQFLNIQGSEDMCEVFVSDDDSQQTQHSRNQVIYL